MRRHEYRCDVIDRGDDERLALVGVEMHDTGLVQAGLLKLLDPACRCCDTCRFLSVELAVWRHGVDLWRHGARHGVLRLLTDLREQCQVEAFLNFGALLGAIREGGMLGHDSDIDLAYVSPHTSPADVILESYGIERGLRALGWPVTGAGCCAGAHTSATRTGADPHRPDACLRPARGARPTAPRYV